MKATTDNSPMGRGKGGVSPAVIVSDKSMPTSRLQGGIVSTLTVDDVIKHVHSGNYTCAPSNARAASVMVHVVDGKSLQIMT